MKTIKYMRNNLIINGNHKKTNIIFKGNKKTNTKEIK